MSQFQIEIKEICYIQDLSSDQFNIFFTFDTGFKTECTILASSGESAYTEIFNPNLNNSTSTVRIVVKIVNSHFPKDDFKGEALLSSNVFKKPNQNEVFSKWITLYSQTKSKNIKGIIKIKMFLHIKSFTETNQMMYKSLSLNSSMTKIQTYSPFKNEVPLPIPNPIPSSMGTSSNKAQLTMKSKDNKEKDVEKDKTLYENRENFIKLTNIDNDLLLINNNDPLIKDIDLTSIDNQVQQYKYLTNNNNNNKNHNKNHKRSPSTLSENLILYSIDYEKSTFSSLIEKETNLISSFETDIISTYTDKLLSNLPNEVVYLKLESACLVDKAIDYYSSVFSLIENYISLKKRLENMSFDLNLQYSQVKMKVKRLKNKKILSKELIQSALQSFNTIINHDSLLKKKNNEKYSIFLTEFDYNSSQIKEIEQKILMLESVFMKIIHNNTNNTNKIESSYIINNESMLKVLNRIKKIKNPTQSIVNINSTVENKDKTRRNMNITKDKLSLKHLSDISEDINDTPDIENKYIHSSSHSYSNSKPQSISVILQKRIKDFSKTVNSNIDFRIIDENKGIYVLDGNRIHIKEGKSNDFLVISSNNKQFELDSFLKSLYVKSNQCNISNSSKVILNNNYSTNFNSNTNTNSISSNNLSSLRSSFGTNPFNSTNRKAFKSNGHVNKKK